MSDALVDTYLAANADYGGGDLAAASGDAVSVRMAEAQAARASIRQRRLLNTRAFAADASDGSFTYKMAALLTAARGYLPTRE